MKYAVIISRYYAEIAAGLERGACAFLAEQGVSPTDIDLFEAPGAYEIPLLAQAAAATGRYAGVICLGCVVKGETAHFEHVSQGAAAGIQQAALATGVPIAFGVLTTYTVEQARARAGDDSKNVGREAASAAWGSARTLKDIGERAGGTQRFAQA